MDSDAILTTGAGDVWLSPSLMAVAPVDVALLGIRELHFAALGQTDYPFETNALSLLPDEARSAYASAVTGFLGQAGSVTPGVADRMLGSLCIHADLYGGFDGLEGPALTALLTSAEGGRTSQAQENLQWLMGEYGLPNVSGGGYQTSAILDRATGTVGFPEIGQVKDRIDQVTSGGASTDSFVRAGARLASEGVGAVLGQEAQQSFNQGVKELTGVIGAVALGAELGSALGPVGSFLGALVGFVVAMFASDSAHQQEQRQEAAKDAAKGDGIVVQGHTHVEKNGSQQVAGKDGQCKPAPSGAENPPPPPPQKKVLEPPHEKCDVGDDILIPPDYETPFWGDTATVVGSGITTGKGLDGLFATHSIANEGIGFRLAATPLIDEAGLMFDSGQAFAVIKEELVATRPNQAIVEDPWAEVRNRLRAYQLKHPGTMDVTEAVDQLAHLGVLPTDSVGLALRQLRRSFGI